MKLSASVVARLALPPGISDKIFFDDELPGFGLRLRRSGDRSWWVQYAVAKRTRKLRLGSVAELDISKARSTAKTVLARVRLGGDPAHEKRAGRLQAGETVGALLPAFLERQHARLKPRSYEETDRHLSRHCKPLHPLAVAALDRRVIAARLAKVAKASGPVAANRARSSLSAFLNWCAREGYIDSNPAAYTNKAAENGGRDRLLTDAELVAIWRGLGGDQYGTIMKLLILTGARRHEIGSLQWSEVDLDDDTVTLSAARTKNRREHVIPLSTSARALLAAQPHRAEGDGSPREFIFGHGACGFSDWSGSKADLDARIAAANKGEPLPHWVPHDFRRAISTTLHERLGVPPHVVETILAHVGGHKSGVAGVYNLASYLDERRRALQRWADHIEQLLGRKKSTKVVKLRSRR